MRLPVLMTLQLSTAALGEVAEAISMRKLESGLGCMKFDGAFQTLSSFRAGDSARTEMAFTSENSCGAACGACIGKV